MSSARIFKTFLPSIPKKVSRKTIIDNFKNMKIGKVFYVDKVDKNKEESVAFVYLSLYETEHAKKWADEVEKKGGSNIIYDKKTGLEWKIYPYLDREHRYKNYKVLVPMKKLKIKKSKKNMEEIDDDNIVYKSVSDTTPTTAYENVENNDTIIYEQPRKRMDPIGTQIVYSSVQTQKDYEELSNEIFVKTKNELEKLAFYELWDGICIDFGVISTYKHNYYV